MTRIPALLLVLALAGCAGPVQQTGDVAPNYLRLQGFAQVDGSAGTLVGFLRWIYVADDPSQFDQARTDCEIWEYLDLVSTAPVEACGGCTDQFEGTAEVEAGDTTCDDVDWTSREFTLAFGAMDIIDEPDPIDARLVLDSTSYTANLQLTLTAEDDHLWATWVSSTSDVGWSEYDYATATWALPAYESYAADTVALRAHLIRRPIGERWEDEPE